MLRSVMKVLLYFILLLLVAAQLGVDVSSLVAILSVISLALRPHLKRFEEQAQRGL